MEADANCDQRTVALRQIVKSQNDLLQIGLDGITNGLRDSLQELLGAESDLHRVAREVNHSAERDSDGIPVSSGERIRKAIEAFWTACNDSRTRINELPVSSLDPLKAFSSDLAWNARLRSAIGTLEEPWLPTRHWQNHPVDSTIEFVRIADRSLSNETQDALVWLCECDAPYPWPDWLKSVRRLSPTEAGNQLSDDEIRELVARYRMFQKTFATYQILDIPETRNGVEIPGIGRRVIGDVVTLNTNEVESRAPNGEESFLNTMFACGMLMKLPGTVASMVAIREAFCGRRTYLPGEAFETDHSSAARLEAAGHAVPADQYTDCRLVRVKALATFNHDGKVLMAGSEFDVANVDAIQFETSGKVLILCDATPFVFIRNPHSGLGRWWPSEVWATVLAGNLLSIAVDHLEMAVGKLRAKLDERGLPRECHLSPESLLRDWFPYELTLIRDDFPRDLHEVWTRCNRFELMVERLPKQFEYGEAWKRDCKAAAIAILNSITDHSGTDPSKNIPAFVRRLHQGESLEGLDSVKEIQRLLVPLRGHSARLPPKVNEWPVTSATSSQIPATLPDEQLAENGIQLIPVDIVILQCLDEAGDWLALETTIWERVKLTERRQSRLRASISALLKSGFIETTDNQQDWETIETPELDEQLKLFDIWPSFLSTPTGKGEWSFAPYRHGKKIPPEFTAVYQLRTYRITLDGTRKLDVLEKNATESTGLSQPSSDERVLTSSQNRDSNTTTSDADAFGDLPHWNPETRVLIFCGKTRKFPPQTGQKVLTILSAFQEFGWRTREDNPLDSEDAKQALRTLNADQSLPIRFEKDGDQIVWVKKSP